MVDTQEVNPTYDHSHQQQADECDATMLSQIPTNELMDLEGEMFPLESYQEVLKLESLPLLEDCKPAPILTAPAALLDHLTKTPTLDEHHDPLFNFNVDLNGENSGKSSWMFSSRLNKVFVKMGQACTFNISYQSFDYQELVVRAMLVCSAPEDMHYPVFRCENHRCSDNNNPRISEVVKTHVMRCFNPSARYVGFESGIAFKDRLAVVIPLGATANDQGSMNISLEFVCQNSCRIINRRATAIIFTLEDTHGQILGKKSLHLKVCSCPKRDKQKEEESLGPAKRKSVNEQPPPPGKKVAKVSACHRHPSQELPAAKSNRLSSSGKLPLIKKESSSDSSTPLMRTQSIRSLSPLSSQELVEQTATTISLPMPNIEMAVKVSEYAFQVVAGDLVRCTDDGQRRHLAAFLSQLRRLQKSLADGGGDTTTGSTNLPSTDSE
ncbi:cellular tumor antigen p53-like isoform X2 [Toxorhynchites rutilus septentrionalis]|nr:cellular tumor antigen p53-like isoform X2 [Toxorhynchites rutilus septentrionalis]